MIEIYYRTKVYGDLVILERLWLNGVINFYKEIPPVIRPIEHSLFTSSEETVRHFELARRTNRDKCI